MYIVIGAVNYEEVGRFETAEEARAHIEYCKEVDRKAGNDTGDDWLIVKET